VFVIGYKKASAGGICPLLCGGSPCDAAWSPSLYQHIAPFFGTIISVGRLYIIVVLVQERHVNLETV